MQLGKNKKLSASFTPSFVRNLGYQNCLPWLYLFPPAIIFPSLIIPLLSSEKIIFSIEREALFSSFSFPARTSRSNSFDYSSTHSTICLAMNRVKPHFLISVSGVIDKRDRPLSRAYPHSGKSTWIELRDNHLITSAVVQSLKGLGMCFASCSTVTWCIF